MSIIVLFTHTHHINQSCALVFSHKYQGILCYVDLFFIIKSIVEDTSRYADNITVGQKSCPMLGVDAKTPLLKPFPKSFCPQRRAMFLSDELNALANSLKQRRSAWGRGTKDPAPGWRVWRATDPCRWKSQETCPGRYQQGDHQRKHHQHRCSR